MDALVLVDIQRDFLPGGALAVPEGDLVVPIANALIERFQCVVATQDWHPADHASFAANHPDGEPGQIVEIDGLNQVLWPVHCVQETPGAEFAAELSTDRFSQIVQKGTDTQIDSYSGFFDNARRRATGLGDYLASNSVQRVYLLGLATDYCVKFTALDARQLGFETFLILDGCRGVGRQAGDIDRALDEMRHAGVVISDSEVLR